MLLDFIQVLYSTGKYSTKDGYIPRHNLFTTTYLLLD
jgi:hypothetical protein